MRRVDVVRLLPEEQTNAVGRLVAQQAEVIEQDRETDASQDDQLDHGQVQPVVVHDEGICHVATEGGHAGVAESDHRMENRIVELLAEAAR